MNTKKLYRSNSDRMIAGVCGGLGQHFDIDSTLLRIGFVVLFLLGGHGLLIYLIMALIVPLEPQPSQSVINVSTPPNNPPENQ
jgi:phage shock protein C